MGNADAFGFSTANRVAAKIAEIKPGVEAQPNPPIAALDRMAEEHGFHSREPADEKILRWRREVGPSAQLNVKCPVPVYNRFIRFCDQERLSYWEGIERLLDLARRDASGKPKA